MSWKTISLYLCIYGVLKEFRPSESYVISYFQSVRMNFTETQVRHGFKLIYIQITFNMFYCYILI